MVKDKREYAAYDGDVMRVTRPQSPLTRVLIRECLDLREWVIMIYYGRT